MGRKHVVAKALRRAGRAGTIKRDVAGVFDPVTSTTSDEETIEVTCKGTMQSYLSEEINGTEILYTDIKYVVPVLDFEDQSDGITVFEPKRGDRVVIEGKGLHAAREYLIENVRTYDGDVAYALQLRGGGEPISDATESS